MDERCFALTPTWTCLAIETRAHKNRCKGSMGCEFYKSEVAQAVASHAAMERIATLPDDQQQHIADKYYGGKMPWMKA